MLSMKRNIVCILQDRELNNKNAPYFSTSKIVRRLISSDKELYATKWSRNSSDDIYYENGLLFFQNYTEYIPVNSIKKISNESPPIFSVENIDFISKRDIIFYSGFNGIDNACQCELKCICLSQCIFSTTESNWLYQHLLANGRIVRRVYLGMRHNIEFRDCAWDTPNEMFSLTGRRSERFRLIGRRSRIGTKMNDLIYLMVFTVPLERYVLLKIKKAVFTEVQSVKLFKGLLIVENSTHFNIYHFEEFIRQGSLTPYKLGDVCHKGKIGSYPTGIPVNFTYDEASPVLFKVDFFMDILTLNSNPTHYISVHPLEETGAEARIVEVKTNSPINDPLIMPCLFFDLEIRAMYKVDEIEFHPDSSPRVIQKTNESIDCYKILSVNGSSSLSKQYTFELSPSNSKLPVEKSSLRVLTYAYNSELNLFGILIQCHKYPQTISMKNTGVVNLYDSSSGEFLRTVKLRRVKISDASYYTLHINSYSLIVIESGVGIRLRIINNVHVHMM